MLTNDTAAATIAAAMATFPELTMMGVPLGIRPHIYIMKAQA